MIASEYSDRIINLNKIEQRNLEVRIKQITKETNTTLLLLKRDIEHVKHEFETNRDRIELLRKQRQVLYEENLRRLLEKNMITQHDMDVLHVHNTSRNLAAFYNFTAKKQEPAEKSNKPLIRREPSRLSARNRSILQSSSKTRTIHSSYTKSNTPKEVTNVRLVNTGGTIRRTAVMMAKRGDLSQYNKDANALNEYVSQRQSKLKSRGTSLDLNSIITMNDDDDESLMSIDDAAIAKTSKQNKAETGDIRTNSIFGDLLVSRDDPSATAELNEILKSSKLVKPKKTPVSSAKGKKDKDKNTHGNNDDDDDNVFKNSSSFTRVSLSRSAPAGSNLRKTNSDKRKDKHENIKTIKFLHEF